MSATGYLPLRLLLTDTAVLRDGFNPLHIQTDPYIPGRALRGMLAAALVHLGETALIEEWVARGERLRFAPALPRLEDRHLSGTSVTALPAPAALRVARSHDGDEVRLVDVLAPNGDEAPTARPVGGFLTPDLEHLVQPRTSAEQYLGRARGGASTQGVPFVTTMLDAGQVFETRWRLRAGSSEELTGLARHILEVLDRAAGRLVIGTGGTRAHGGGIQIGLLPGTDPKRPVVAERIDRRGGAPDWPEGEERDLLLLAPALVLDEYGETRPEALPSAVAALGERVLGAGAATVLGSVLERQRVEGYHRRYTSAMAARWAAAPGSVVRLRANRRITAEEVRALEAETVGSRAADGCGCFTLLPIPDTGRQPPDVEKPHRPTPAERRGGGHGEDGPEAPTVPLPDGRSAPLPPGWPAGTDDTPEEVRALFETLLRSAAADPVRSHARALATATTPGELPTPSLLGRLREVATRPGRAADTLAALARTVEGFALPARTAVGRPVISHGGKRISLAEWLTGAATDPVAWWRRESPDLDAALARVDLARGPDDGAESSAAARAWLTRPAVAADLAVLLISTWLAEAARARRAADERERS